MTDHQILFQTCHISYTKVHTTVGGKGWGDEGIARFNELLLSVMIDRTKRGTKFDHRFQEYCNAHFSKKKQSNPDEQDSNTTRLKGLTPDDIVLGNYVDSDEE